MQADRDGRRARCSTSPRSQRWSSSTTARTTAACEYLTEQLCRGPSEGRCEAIRTPALARVSTRSGRQLAWRNDVHVELGCDSFEAGMPRPSRGSRAEAKPSDRRALIVAPDGTSQPDAHGAFPESSDNVAPDQPAAPRTAPARTGCPARRCSCGGRHSTRSAGSTRRFTCISKTSTSAAGSGAARWDIVRVPACTRGPRGGDEQHQSKSA